MKQLADISSFESINNSAGGSIVVANGLFGRVSGDTNAPMTLSSASRSLLGSVTDEIPLPYQYHLGEGKWGDNSLRNTPNAKSEYQRGRGPGKTMWSLLNGVKKLIADYIKHTAPETKFVIETLRHQTNDIMQFLSFMKEPVVRKQMKLSNADFQAMKNAVTSCIEECQASIEKQVVAPMSEMLGELQQSAENGKSHSLTKWIYDQLPNPLSDSLSVWKLQRTLKTASEENRQAAIDKFKIRQDRLRQEAKELGDYKNAEVFDYEANPDNPLKLSADFMTTDIKGKGKEYGRFSNKDDGKGNNFNFYTKMGDHHGKVIYDLLKDKRDQIVSQVAGGDRNVKDALQALFDKFSWGKSNKDNGGGGGGSKKKKNKKNRRH